jgi:osomolarity two-component system sensor histidine kinase SLN1
VATTAIITAFLAGPKTSLECSSLCPPFGTATRTDLYIRSFTTGLPVIALFGLGLKRLPAAIGALIFFVCSCVLVLPYRTAWFRNVLDFLIFHAFLLYVHYMREHAERRLYSLRDQLKVQFRATQKAQVNERKASDSKRRLTS